MACAACGLWRLGPASCGVRAVGRGRRVIFDLFGWKARFMWRAGCGRPLPARRFRLVKSFHKVLYIDSAAERPSASKVHRPVAGCLPLAAWTVRPTARAAGRRLSQFCSCVRVVGRHGAFRPQRFRRDRDGAARTPQRRAWLGTFSRSTAGARRSLRRQGRSTHVRESVCVAQDLVRAGQLIRSGSAGSTSIGNTNAAEPTDHRPTAVNDWNCRMGLRRGGRA